MDHGKATTEWRMCVILTKMQETPTIANQGNDETYLLVVPLGNRPALQIHSMLRSMSVTLEKLKLCFIKEKHNEAGLEGLKFIDIKDVHQPKENLK